MCPSVESNYMNYKITHINSWFFGISCQYFDRVGVLMFSSSLCPLTWSWNIVQPISASDSMDLSQHANGNRQSERLCVFNYERSCTSNTQGYIGVSVTQKLLTKSRDFASSALQFYHFWSWPKWIKIFAGNTTSCLSWFGGISGCFEALNSMLQ